MRCFLALPLAEPALSEAGRLQAVLGARIPEVRWARPETLHVTVHFFGEVDDPTVALAAVTPVAASTDPFEMRLDSLGSFPPGGVPRVLWLGHPVAAANLTAFAGRCHAALRDVGFRVESRPYTPHCTLGRPRRHWSDAARIAWRSALTEPCQVMRWNASRMVLYDSRSAPGGAVYTEQATLPFAAR